MLSKQFLKQELKNEPGFAQESDFLECVAEDGPLRPPDKL